MTAKELRRNILSSGLTSAMILVAAHALAQGAPGGIDPGVFTGAGPGAARESREAIQRSKIKSASVWRYPVDAAGAEGAPTRISSAAYDSQGNRVRQTLLDQEVGRGRDVVNRFDERGRVLETFNQVPDKSGNARMTYDYDAKGHMRELRSYKADGTVLLSMVYVYDPAGNPTEMAALAGDGRLLYKAVCDYGQSGKMTAMKVYWDGGKSAKAPAGQPNGSAPVLSMLYDYDKNGRPLVQTRLDAQGKPLVRTVWSYDGGPGGPARTTTYNGEGKVVTDLTCALDGHGRISEEVSTFPAADLRTRITWRYDANGNPLEKTTYNKADKPVEIVRYVYEYYAGRG